MVTTTYSTTLVAVSCGECGTPFGLAEDYQAARRRDHATFWCPNGHRRAYLQESEAEKLKRELKWERDRLASERARADGAEASLRATKGHVTRLRNRVIAGECSFCGQHLRDLARHISRQHPDETPEVISDTDR